MQDGRRRAGGKERRDMVVLGREDKLLRRLREKKRARKNTHQRGRWTGATGN